MIPGQYYISDEPITANRNRSTRKIIVKNTGDRPIQVGSHIHFFEANKALEFIRANSYGYHLNIPAGTSVRFEPGDTREIDLVEFGGKRIVFGFSGLVNGDLNTMRDTALKRAAERGFKGA